MPSRRGGLGRGKMARCACCVAEAVRDTYSLGYIFGKISGEQRMQRFLIAFITIALALLTNAAAVETRPELRGVWVTRFEWATPDAGECKDRITRILEALAEKNFNAVVFQIRGEADTLYPSQIEPSS